MKAIYFTNSKSHQREEFKPADVDRVTFYSCGPTVYSHIHVGNLRAAFTSDLIFRVLKQFGYGVCYVRNYTDVDDKILDRARKEESSMELVSKRFIAEVEKDYALAGLLEPTHKTLVTEHISEIIQMIEDILKNGCAYVSGGEVFFAIDQFKRYGELSGRKLEDLQAGSRVEVNANKKNPMDFSLWKPAKPGEPSWPSPWGAGRPGWHIECSAMAKKWLGPQIDLHHGGQDLLFPHHENEVAQTEAATGMHPSVGVWLHNAFVNFDQEKMSKSIGNVVLARDFLSQYGAELTRFIFLSSHYRSPLELGTGSIEHALQGMERFYEAKASLMSASKARAMVPDPRREEVWGGVLASLAAAERKFEEALSQDLNTVGALAEVFILIREWNRVSQEAGMLQSPGAIQCAQAILSWFDGPLFESLGIGRRSPEQVAEQIKAIRLHLSALQGRNTLSDAEIEEKIAARQAARKNKDFALSDQIRNELTQNGVEILDSASGTTWKRR
jgi:cysteinyl-tRNA synthetase